MATLDDLAQICAEATVKLRLVVGSREQESEGEIILWMQECGGGVFGTARNPSDSALIPVGGAMGLAPRAIAWLERKGSALARKAVPVILGADMLRERAE